MATRAELEDQVGYKLNLTISADSIPNSTDVQQWLNEGQLDVARKVHPQLAPALIEEESIFVAAGETTFALSSLLKPFIRLIAASYAVQQTSDEKICKIVDAGQYNALKLSSSSGFLVPTTENPVVSIHNDNLAFYPPSDSIGGGAATIIYYREPDILASDTTECELPAFLEDLVVDYAVMQAKIQDEQFDQAMVIYKNYLTTISLLNRTATQRRFENV